MTAFGRAEGVIGGKVWCWELRSVNHRYLELSFKIPEVQRALEIELRKLVRSKIARGKVECFLRIDKSNEALGGLKINNSLVESLVSSAASLADNHHLANDLSVSQILSWPDVLEEPQDDFSCIKKDALRLFNAALDQLQAMRGSEGHELQEYIVKRLNAVEKEIEKSAKFATDNATIAKRKLLAKLNNLNDKVDGARLEQEIALMLTRLDITEELDRLKAHVKEVHATLGRKEPIGRRLDFLMQEFNREANTLSSKSDSIGLTNCAVEMKVLIEQMREQVQNIE